MGRTWKDQGENATLRLNATRLLLCERLEGRLVMPVMPKKAKMVKASDEDPLALENGGKRGKIVKHDNFVQVEIRLKKELSTNYEKT